MLPDALVAFIRREIQSARVPTVRVQRLQERCSECRALSWDVAELQAQSTAEPLALIRCFACGASGELRLIPERSSVLGEVLIQELSQDDAESGQGTDVFHFDAASEPKATTVPFVITSDGFDSTTPFDEFCATNEAADEELAVMVYASRQLLQTLDDAFREDEARGGGGVMQIFFKPNGSPQAVQAAVRRIIAPKSAFLRACPLTAAERHELEAGVERVCQSVTPRGLPIHGLAVIFRAAFEDLQALVTNYQSQQKIRYLSAAVQRNKLAARKLQRALAGELLGCFRARHADQMADELIAAEESSAANAKGGAAWGGDGADSAKKKRRVPKKKGKPQPQQKEEETGGEKVVVAKVEAKVEARAETRAGAPKMVETTEEAEEMKEEAKKEVEAAASVPPAAEPTEPTTAAAERQAEAAEAKAPPPPSLPPVPPPPSPKGSTMRADAAAFVPRTVASPPQGVGAMHHPAARAQVEFYFSDQNLSGDAYLRARVNEEPSGYVDLALVNRFNRMRSIGLTTPQLAHALRASPLLELDSDGRRVRRRPSAAPVPAAEAVPMAAAAVPPPASAAAPAAAQQVLIPQAPPPKSPHASAAARAVAELDRETAAESEDEAAALAHALAASQVDEEARKREAKQREAVARAAEAAQLEAARLASLASANAPIPPPRPPPLQPQRQSPPPSPRAAGCGMVADVVGAAQAMTYIYGHEIVSQCMHMHMHMHTHNMTSVPSMTLSDGRADSAARIVSRRGGSGSGSETPSEASAEQSSVFGGSDADRASLASAASLARTVMHDEPEEDEFADTCTLLPWAEAAEPAAGEAAEAGEAEAAGAAPGWAGDGAGEGEGEAELTQDNVLRAVEAMPELREQVASILGSAASEEAKMREVRKLLLFPPLPSSSPTVPPKGSGRTQRSSRAKQPRSSSALPQFTK